MRAALAMATVLVLAALPLLAPWLQFVLTLAIAKGFAALGVAVLLRAGLISIGHAMFFAASAYSVAFLTGTGVGDLATLLVFSVLIAALTGAIVGAFLIRYRAIFFAMLNLAVSMVFYALFAKLYGVPRELVGERIIGHHVFDADRDGFVPAEGAGVLVLERAEDARARGARIHAVVRGFGAATDAHHATFKEFIDNTPWEKYGRGRDPRCQDCMVQSGYEPSAVLGGNKKLGDTWKMLKWQLSGRMGGAKKGAKTNGNGHAYGDGNGQSNGHSNGRSSGNDNGHSISAPIPGNGAPQEEVFRIL